MKAGEIIDAAIQENKSDIVIELPNGQRIATTGYYHSDNKRGEPVIVITAGRKVGK